MKNKLAEVDSHESKSKVKKKRAAEDPRPTLAKKLRDKKDGETREAGLKSAGVQRKTGSILHYIYKSTLGQSLHTHMRQCLQEPFIRSLSSYHFHGSSSLFDRRITCLEWHPTHPTTLAAASKGGDIFLLDFTNPTNKTFYKGGGRSSMKSRLSVDGAHSFCVADRMWEYTGAFSVLQEINWFEVARWELVTRVTDMKFNQLNPTQLYTSSMGGTTALERFQWDHPNSVYQHRNAENGAGDSIGGMKFCPTDLSKVYLASGEGTLTLKSFEGHAPTLLSRTADCDHNHHDVCFWYCCVDVSVSRQMLVTGDNMGQLVLLGLDGQKIFREKLHKAKVTHAEFNPRCDWLLATASVDHTVKLWDLRNLKDKKSFLHELPHEKAVNSAYFNPSDCSKLLTTDQYDQIRVYASCDWTKPQQIIQHPHRQFQHLTPIKATWHPMYDLIVAGRYPDDRFCTTDERTIDIFDSNTGELVFQLYDSTATGIKSINKFSPMGDRIGSGMGLTLLVWDHDESLVDDRDKPHEETPTSSGSLRGQRRSLQRSSRDRKGSAGDAKLKKKLAALEETETKTKTKQKQAQTKKKK